jgi:hypothetical protein
MGDLGDVGEDWNRVRSRRLDGLSVDVGCTNLTTADRPYDAALLLPLISIHIVPMGAPLGSLRRGRSFLL